MAWFKVDDTLSFNAKVIAAGNEAIGAWVRAGAWCAAQLTDGVIPKHVFAVIAGEANAEAIASRLLQVALINESDDGSSYVFHDWFAYQPSASEVRSRRDDLSRKRAEAGRRGGEKSGLTRRNSVKQEGSKAEANGEQSTGNGTKQNEAPSHPIPSPKKTSSTDVNEAFDSWWSHYPKKVDKGHARTAYKAALKKTDEDTLLAAVIKYAAAAAGKDRKFIAHASTWLNGERWGDDDTQTEVTPEVPRWMYG